MNLHRWDRWLSIAATALAQVCSCGSGRQPPDGGDGGATDIGIFDGSRDRADGADVRDAIDAARLMRALTLKIVDTNACGGNYSASVTVSTDTSGPCSIVNTTATLSTLTCTVNYPDGQLATVTASTLGGTVFNGSGLTCGSDATNVGNCQAGSSGICTCTFLVTAPRTVLVSICHP